MSQKEVRVRERYHRMGRLYSSHVRGRFNEHETKCLQDIVEERVGQTNTQVANVHGKAFAFKLHGGNKTQCKLR